MRLTDTIGMAPPVPTIFAAIPSKKMSLDGYHLNDRRKKVATPQYHFPTTPRDSPTHVLQIEEFAMTKYIPPMTGRIGRTQRRIIQ